MHETTSHRHFVPGLGRAWLTPFYDLAHRFSGIGDLHAEMIRLADLRPGMRVLDLGCGTGNLLLAAGRAHPGVELAGLDPDPRALSAAARKAHRAKVAVAWERGFADDLPHADGSVDRVFSSLMLHHLEPAAKTAMLAEVRRVLRPDGVFVLADMDGHAAMSGRGFLHRRMSRSAEVRHMLHANAGMADRLTAAGLTAGPAVVRPMRIGEITVLRSCPEVTAS